MTVTISGIAEAPDYEIDVKRHRFPLCLVFCPIPVLTWILPSIGHVAIATTDGVIHDFSGPYSVTHDDMAFGWPTRYLQLDAKKVVGQYDWDSAIAGANSEYKGRMHNLCCDNCHSHVAMALNLMSYSGKSNWTMVSVWWLVLTRGHSIGITGFLVSWLPSIIIYSVIFLLIAFIH